MRLDATPSDAMYDEPVAIRLAGLPPINGVTMRAAARDDLGQRWESRAEFVAGPDGALDLALQPPLAGSYATADPAGLLWSLELDRSIVERSAFIKTNADPVAIAISAEIGGISLATTKLMRRFLAPGIVKSEVTDDGLVGAMFHDEAAARPGIIVLGGSGGGMAIDHPALLASRGYAVLSLAYFATAGLPATLADIPLEYFERALEWMRRHPGVCADRIAVIGHSRGGELALLLGATFPDIKAVVAYAPSGVVWPGLGGEPRTPSASWTWRGRPLPFIEPAPPDTAAWSNPPVVLTPWFLKSMRHRESAEAAAIPVERINGPVLMFSGTDDRMWPSLNLADFAVQRLIERDFPHPYEHVSYAGAGHFIRFPYHPVISEIFHPIARAPMALGGTPEANQIANLDSWRRCLSFLAKFLA
jgi:pimeloyl-ACP methyl ester carboxylesterase